MNEEQLNDHYQKELFDAMIRNGCFNETQADFLAQTTAAVSRSDINELKMFNPPPNDKTNLIASQLMLNFLKKHDMHHTIKSTKSESSGYFIEKTTDAYVADELGVSLNNLSIAHLLKIHEPNSDFVPTTLQDSIQHTIDSVLPPHEEEEDEEIPTAITREETLIAEGGQDTPTLDEMIRQSKMSQKLQKEMEKRLRRAQKPKKHHHYPEPKSIVTEILVEYEEEEESYEEEEPKPERFDVGITHRSFLCPSEVPVDSNELLTEKFQSEHSTLDKSNLKEPDFDYSTYESNPAQPSTTSMEFTDFMLTESSAQTDEDDMGLTPSMDTMSNITPSTTMTPESPQNSTSGTYTYETVSVTGAAVVSYEEFSDTEQPLSPLTSPGRYAQPELESNASEFNTTSESENSDNKYAGNSIIGSEAFKSRNTDDESQSTMETSPRQSPEVTNSQPSFETPSMSGDYSSDMTYTYTYEDEAKRGSSSVSLETPADSYSDTTDQRGRNGANRLSAIKQAMVPPELGRPVSTTATYSYTYSQEAAHTGSTSPFASQKRTEVVISSDFNSSEMERSSTIGIISEPEQDSEHTDHQKRLKDPPGNMLMSANDEYQESSSTFDSTNPEFENNRLNKKLPKYGDRKSQDQQQKDFKGKPITTMSSDFDSSEPDIYDKSRETRGQTHSRAFNNTNTNNVTNNSTATKNTPMLGDSELESFSVSLESEMEQNNLIADSAARQQSPMQSQRTRMGIPPPLETGSSALQDLEDTESTSSGLSLVPKKFRMQTKTTTYSNTNTYTNTGKAKTKTSVRGDLVQEVSDFDSSNTDEYTDKRKSTVNENERFQKVTVSDFDSSENLPTTLTSPQQPQRERGAPAEADFDSGDYSVTYTYMSEQSLQSPPPELKDRILNDPMLSTDEITTGTSEMSIGEAISSPKSTSRSYYNTKAQSVRSPVTNLMSEDELGSFESESTVSSPTPLESKLTQRDQKQRANSNLYQSDAVIEEDFSTSDNPSVRNIPNGQFLESAGSMFSESTMETQRKLPRPPKNLGREPSIADESYSYSYYSTDESSSKTGPSEKTDSGTYTYESFTAPDSDAPPKGRLPPPPKSLSRPEASAVNISIRSNRDGLLGSDALQTESQTSEHETSIRSPSRFGPNDNVSSTTWDSTEDAHIRKKHRVRQSSEYSTISEPEPNTDVINNTPASQRGLFSKEGLVHRDPERESMKTHPGEDVYITEYYSSSSYANLPAINNNNKSPQRDNRRSVFMQNNDSTFSETTSSTEGTFTGIQQQQRLPPPPKNFSNSFRPTSASKNTTARHPTERPTGKQLNESDVLDGSITAESSEFSTESAVVQNVPSIRNNISRVDSDYSSESSGDERSNRSKRFVKAGDSSDSDTDSDLDTFDDITPAGYSYNPITRRPLSTIHAEDSYTYTTTASRFERSKRSESSESESESDIDYEPVYKFSARNKATTETSTKTRTKTASNRLPPPPKELSGISSRQPSAHLRGNMIDTVTDTTYTTSSRMTLADALRMMSAKNENKYAEGASPSDYSSDLESMDDTQTKRTEKIPGKPINTITSDATSESDIFSTKTKTTRVPNRFVSETASETSDSLSPAKTKQTTMNTRSKADPNRFMRNPNEKESSDRRDVIESSEIESTVSYTYETVPTTSTETPRKPNRFAQKDSESDYDTSDDYDTGESPVSSPAPVRSERDLRQSFERTNAERPSADRMMGTINSTFGEEDTATFTDALMNEEDKKPDKRFIDGYKKPKTTIDTGTVEQRQRKHLPPPPDNLRGETNIDETTSDSSEFGIGSVSNAKQAVQKGKRFVDDAEKKMASSAALSDMSIDSESTTTDEYQQVRRGNAGGYAKRSNASGSTLETRTTAATNRKPERPQSNISQSNTIGRNPTESIQQSSQEKNQRSERSQPQIKQSKKEEGEKPKRARKESRPIPNGAYQSASGDYSSDSDLPPERSALPNRERYAQNSDDERSTTEQESTLPQRQKPAISAQEKRSSSNVKPVSDKNSAVSKPSREPKQIMEYSESYYSDEETEEAKQQSVRQTEPAKSKPAPTSSKSAKDVFGKIEPEIPKEAAEDQKPPKGANVLPMPQEEEQVPEPHKEKKEKLPEPVFDDGVKEEEPKQRLLNPNAPIGPLRNPKIAMMKAEQEERERSRPHPPDEKSQMQNKNESQSQNQNQEKKPSILLQAVLKPQTDIADSSTYTTGTYTTDTYYESEPESLQPPPNESVRSMRAPPGKMLSSDFDEAFGLNETVTDDPDNYTSMPSSVDPPTQRFRLHLTSETSMMESADPVKPVDLAPKPKPAKEFEPLHRPGEQPYQAPPKQPVGQRKMVFMSDTTSSVPADESEYTYMLSTYDEPKPAAVQKQTKPIPNGHAPAGTDALESGEYETFDTASYTYATVDEGESQTMSSTHSKRRGRPRMRTLDSSALESSDTFGYNPSARKADGVKPVPKVRNFANNQKNQTDQNRKYYEPESDALESIETIPDSASESDRPSNYNSGRQRQRNRRVHRNPVKMPGAITGNSALNSDTGTSQTFTDFTGEVRAPGDRFREKNVKDPSNVDTVTYQ